MEFDLVAVNQLEHRDHSRKPFRGPVRPSFEFALLHPKYWLQWAAIGLLSLIWVVLPISWRDSLGKWCGAWLSKGRWPRRIPQNLQRCFPNLTQPEQERITLEFCQAQACVLLDLPALWLSSPKKQFARVHVNGLEHLESVYQANRPVCLLVCHSLGMEHAARALKWSYPMLGYYQPFGSRVIDWLFYRFRSDNGGYLLKRGESLRHLVRDLRDNWMLYMMIDEDMGEDEGHWVSFFAAQKCGIKAPAKLTAMAGATALPVYSWYNLDKQRYEIDILPALLDFPTGDSRADVGLTLKVLEQMIGCRVEQYNWRQKLFRSENRHRASGEQ
ncbi:MAG: lysophospholipid acyltransferase family protein [Granulosicoccaceae bacterium]